MSVQINLDGLKFSSDGSQVCAVCGYNFDAQQEDEEGNYQVPLLLWRNEGREMMTLCWSCAEPRIKLASPQEEGFAE